MSAMPTFDCYGHWPVLEALRSGQVRRVFLVPRPQTHRAQRDDVATEAVALGVPVTTLTREELDAQLPGVHHQGVAAELFPFRYASLDDVLPHHPTVGAHGLWPLTVALDEVQDPQNMGNLLRTAETAGVLGVILPRHRSAEITPSVRRAAAGATAHLNITQVTNLGQSLQVAQQRGYWVIGLDMAGELPYYSVDALRPLVLVVGSEGRGIGRLIRERCDYVVSLPMWGHIASLNAATAAAIALYDLRRIQTTAQKEST